MFYAIQYIILRTCTVESWNHCNCSTNSTNTSLAERSISERANVGVKQSLKFNTQSLYSEAGIALLQKSTTEVKCADLSPRHLLGLHPWTALRDFCP